MAHNFCYHGNLVECIYCVQVQTRLKNITPNQTATTSDAVPLPCDCLMVEALFWSTIMIIMVTPTPQMQTTNKEPQTSIGCVYSRWRFAQLVGSRGFKVIQSSFGFVARSILLEVTKTPIYASSCRETA